MSGFSEKARLAIILVALTLLSSTAISTRIPTVTAPVDPCLALGGILVGTECQVQSNQVNKAGTYTIAHTLRVMSGKTIDATLPGTTGISLSITGDFIMETNSKIEANDDGINSGLSARPITIVVSGNMEMQAGSVIEARNTNGAGNGANIAVTVSGNLLMAGATDTTPGARIDNSAGGASGNAAGSSLTISVGGNMEMGSGSIIKGESVQNGNGSAISITVGGDLTLHGSITGPPAVDGALISSSVPGGTGGNAGSITVNVGNCAASPPTGEVVVEPGAKVQANTLKGAGGAIVMAACSSISMDGLIQSHSGRSGSGATQGPGGGPITLDAGCDLTISDTGVVSSSGIDPGADLVRLKGGCKVLIFGLVESTGPGHAVPNSPKNHCDSTDRPDKPAGSTTCVEVWAGDSLVIDSDIDEGHAGEINADHTGSCGGRGWIDLFARGDITIDGDTTGAFAVHADNNCANSQVGGIVNVASTEGEVAASDLAISADANVAGGTGGSISVLAKKDVILDTASLFARGDFSQSGGYGFGGKIGTLGGDGVDGNPDIPGIRSFTGTVSWQNGVGDVRPTGTDSVGGLLAANRGEIIIQDCTNGPVNLAGTTFPNNGLPATTPTELAKVCSGAPTVPSYVTLPICACKQVPPTCKWCTKGAVLSQVTQNIGFCCAVPDILVDLRMPKNDPILPEELGSNNPATGSLQAAINYVNSPDWLLNDPTPGDGEIFIGVTARDCDTGIVGSGACLDQTGRGPGGPAGQENVVITNPYENMRLNVFGCGVGLIAEDQSMPVISIKNSVGKVTVLDIEVKGSNVAGYLIQNDADLVVVKAGSATNNGIGYWIQDDNVQITGAPSISFNGIGIKAVGSNVQIKTSNVLSNTGDGVDIQGSSDSYTNGLVQRNGGTGMSVTGDNNVIKSDELYLNGGDGINVAGNNNQIVSNDVGDQNMGNTGDGIHVVGNSNLMDGNNVFASGGDGFDVTGNSNIVKRSSVGDKGMGNSGDGIHVAGSGNTVQDNSVYANTGDGIDVSGGSSASPNVISKNKVGDRSGKGNLGNGIIVSGTGNGKANPIEIDSNTVKANGLTGIKVTGTGHQLKNNQSGGSSAADKNGLCAFNVAAGNFNATGNKANGVTVPGSSGSPFPTGCL